MEKRSREYFRAKEYGPKPLTLGDIAVKCLQQSKKRRKYPKTYHFDGFAQMHGNNK